MIMFLSEVLFKRGVLVCSQCRFYRSRSANPGVGRRLKIFQQGDPSLSQTKLTEEDFDDSEVDINSRALADEYQREYQRISKRIALKRIEREYFDKTKTPNFLLWSEKEQIRHLHHSEPDRWTFDALSQSFPATPDVIKKIVKAQYKKDSAAIKKHDDKVIDNWKAFEKKKLDLPPRTAEHLSKFTARERLPQLQESKELQTIEEHPPSTPGKLFPTKSTQYIDIIRKYKNPDGASEPKMQVGVGEKLSNTPTRPSETYVIGGRLSKRLQREQFTLSEMKQSGVISKGSESEPSSSPEITSDSSSEPPARSAAKSKAVLNSPNVDSFSIPRYASASTLVEPNDEPPEDVPMKISIPKDKWRKGAVYKVNNCFYADDGEFLYKVS